MLAGRKGQAHGPDSCVGRPVAEELLHVLGRAQKRRGGLLRRLPLGRLEEFDFSDLEAVDAAKVRNGRDKRGEQGHKDLREPQLVAQLAQGDLRGVVSPTCQASGSRAP